MNFLKEYNKQCRLLADIQGQIFKKSAEENIPSYFFIKVFMYSDDALLFDDLSLLTSYVSTEEIYSNIAHKVKRNRGEIYNSKEIFWIGYFYRSFCYLYDVRSHTAFELVPVAHLKKAYSMYHTQDIRKAIQWVVDDLNITFKDNQQKIYDILRTVI